MAEQGMGGWLSGGRDQPGRPHPAGPDRPRAREGLAGAEARSTIAKLWTDWLAFLQGAAENGGLVVQ